MARHWSTLVNVTERQARALDEMAKEHGFYSGRELLMSVADVSISKLSKLDLLTVQQHVNTAFERYGR